MTPRKPFLSAGSLTPQKRFPFLLFHRGHWPRGNHFSGVIDPAEMISFFGCFCGGHWPRGNFAYTFFSQNLTWKIWFVSAGSWTPRKRFPRGQWPRWNGLRGSLTPLKFDYNQFSRRIRGHMRNGFRPRIRALGRVDWWKKPRVKNLMTLSL
jgi:hypothetical protein